MNSVRWSRRSTSIATAVLGLALSVSSLSAQRKMSFYGAFYRSDGAEVVSGGGNVQLGSGRVSPTVGLNLFWASYPGARTTDDGVTSIGVTPAVGLMVRPNPEMFLHGSVGYHFASDNFNPIFAEGSGGSDGVVTSGMVGLYQLWPVSVEGIGSYNWGSEYLWSRARATARVASLGKVGLSFGAEAVYQGDDTGKSTSYGPLVRFSWPSNLSVGVGAGWRDIPNVDRSPSYWKVEVGWYR